MKKTILLIVTALFLINCSTQQAAKKSDFQRADDIQNPDPSISLLDHLQRVPGIQVEGSSSNARVKVRGISSINSSNEPLFVLDGQQLAGGLSQAIQIIPVAQIKTIRVLKNPQDVAIYGVRGANGVIEIKMKSVPN